METLTEIYGTYIANALDIIILTVIFYKVILLIRGTRATQVMLGVLLVLALTIIARDVLHLQALTWLLSNFWLAAVIILAVVFQSEIRSMLAQIGSTLWGHKTKLKGEYVNDIVEVVEDMSSSKCGCLIVIENETGLRNYVETGVLLNADISAELLLTIFKNKNTPLHDGATIIYQDRIAAAGCLLPLSNSRSIKIYGTRHRAALGLSEVADAIVIVVSEETGHISIAYKSKLYSNISTIRLKEFITTNGEVLNKK